MIKTLRLAAGMFLVCSITVLADRAAQSREAVDGYIRANGRLDAMEFTKWMHRDQHAFMVKFIRLMVSENSPENRDVFLQQFGIDSEQMLETLSDRDIVERFFGAAYGMLTDNAKMIMSEVNHEIVGVVEQKGDYYVVVNLGYEGERSQFDTPVAIPAVLVVREDRDGMRVVSSSTMNTIREKLKMIEERKKSAAATSSVPM